MDILDRIGRRHGTTAERLAQAEADLGYFRTQIIRATIAKLQGLPDLRINLYQLHISDIKVYIEELKSDGLP
jgi:hypothetical protein